VTFLQLLSQEVGAKLSGQLLLCVFIICLDVEAALEGVLGELELGLLLAGVEGRAGDVLYD